MSESPDNKRIHPLVAGAAVSVILFSLVGVAALTGVLPSSNGVPKTDAQRNAASASSVAVSSVASNAPGIAANVADNATPKNITPLNLPPSEQQAVSASGGNASVSAGTTSSQQNAATTASVTQKLCKTCGVIESILPIEQQEAHGSGLGAVAGAVLGGVLGHQVGNGNGRSLATVAGTVGGGFAGNAIEKRAHTTTVYEVKVKLDNGHYRVFNFSAQPEYREGDRVHIEKGRVVLG